MKISPSKNRRKEKNVINLEEDFVSSILPGLDETKKTRTNKDWVKYLRLSIAIIRMAEYDYLVNRSGSDFDTAKIFLFGSNNIFTCICDLMKIDKKMARMKILAYKKSGIIGDPLFETISNEFTDPNISLSPTSIDINKINKGKR